MDDGSQAGQCTGGRPGRRDRGWSARRRHPRRLSPHRRQRPPPAFRLSRSRPSSPSQSLALCYTPAALSVTAAGAGAAFMSDHGPRLADAEIVRARAQTTLEEALRAWDLSPRDHVDHPDCRHRAPSRLPAIWHATSCGETRAPMQCATWRARSMRVPSLSFAVSTPRLGFVAIVGVGSHRHRHLSRRDTGRRRRALVSPGSPIAIMTGVAFLVGAACSMVAGHHRHVHQRSRRTCAPRPRRDTASSRRSRSRCAVAPSPASSSSHCRCSASGASSRSTRTFVGEVTVAEAPFLIVGFGFGASFVALFAQLGGGIYTKAADVGSRPRRQGRGGHPRGRSAQRGRRSRTSSATTSATAPVAAPTCSSQLLPRTSAR